LVGEACGMVNGSADTASHSRHAFGRQDTASRLIDVNRAFDVHYVDDCAS
jgi:hypothetical protein